MSDLLNTLSIIDYDLNTNKINQSMVNDCNTFILMGHTAKFWINRIVVNDKILCFYTKSFQTSSYSWNLISLPAKLSSETEITVTGFRRRPCPQKMSDDDEPFKWCITLSDNNQTDDELTSWMTN
jgi:hypothetical protein